MAAILALLLATVACGDSSGGVDSEADGATDARPRDGAIVDTGPALDGATDGSLDAGPDASLDGASPDATLPAPQDPFDGIGSVTVVRGGFTFLEGPHYRAADSVLLFTDIPETNIHRLVPPDAIDLFRADSQGANGLATDGDGLLLAAEHGARRVSRTLADGRIETVAERFMGDRLNSPNDLDVRDDGTIYFTDPPYGLAGRTQEVPFNGVYRVAPDGSLSAEWMGPLDSRPNGIVLSPAQTVIYVADTSAGRVRAHDVARDGSLGAPRDFVTNTPNADGMAIDETGNLYVATAEGVKVYSREGASWGTIDIPMRPANCAFGDDDYQTLYVTAQSTLYRVRIPIRGLP